MKITPISGEIASGHGSNQARRKKQGTAYRKEGGLAGIEHLLVVRRPIQTGCPVS
jgi:hypothetical protein